MAKLNPDAFADQLLPLAGPFTPDAVAAAALVVAELVRRLNHATLAHNRGESLPYPQDVDRVLGALAVAQERLGQTLNQLAASLDQWAGDARVTVSDGGIGPRTVADVAAIHIRSAETYLGSVGAELAGAARFTSRLGYDE